MTQRFEHIAVYIMIMTHRFEHGAVFLVDDGRLLVLAEGCVTHDLLDLVFQLLEPTWDILMMLIQRTQPQLIPQDRDAAKLLNQLLHLRYHPVS